MSLIYHWLKVHDIHMLTTITSVSEEYTQRNMSAYCRDASTPMITAALFTIAKVQPSLDFYALANNETMVYIHSGVLSSPKKE